MGTLPTGVCRQKVDSARVLVARGLPICFDQGKGFLEGERQPMVVASAATVTALSEHG